MPVAQHITAAVHFSPYRGALSQVALFLALASGIEFRFSAGLCQPNRT